MVESLSAHPELVADVVEIAWEEWGFAQAVQDGEPGIVLTGEL